MVNYSSAFTDRVSCTKHFIKEKKANNLEFIEQSTRLNIYIEADFPSLNYASNMQINALAF